MSQLDLVVIGSGPGGYVAAIKAAQLGLKVALVEKDPTLGGTCLNVGCIPSKALLHSTETWRHVQHAKHHGIVGAEKLSFDVPTMLANKDKVVAQLNKGVEFLVSKRGVEIVRGLGRLGKAGQVLVRGAAGERVLETKNILIATGSVPVELPFMKFDGETVISSDHGISLKAVPEKMVVVGADDDHLLRDGLEGDAMVRGDDGLAVELHEGQLDRHGAGGDEDVLGLEDALAGGAADEDLAGLAESAEAADDLDAALGDEELDALVELGDDLVLVGEHGRDVEAELLGADDAVVLGVLHMAPGLRRVEQGLGGDAADVEAGAAERGILLHEGYLEAELGGLDGGDVATGAGADYDEIELGHG